MAVKLDTEERVPPVHVDHSVATTTPPPPLLSVSAHNPLGVSVTSVSTPSNYHMVTTAAPYPTGPLSAIISMEPLSPATSPMVGEGGAQQAHIIMHTDQLGQGPYSPTGHMQMGGEGNSSFEDFDTTPNSDSDMNQQDSKRKRKSIALFSSSK